jgi:hypothetical protein
MSYELSQAELEQHLGEKASFLRASAQAFDAGFEAEAKRLATSIRILVHDTRNSRSLIDQLGLKDGIRFEDTTIRRIELPPGEPDSADRRRAHSRARASRRGRAGAA